MQEMNFAMCGDGERISQVTEKLMYVFPCIKDCFASFCKLYTGVDMLLMGKDSAMADMMHTDSANEESYVVCDLNNVFPCKKRI